MNLLNIAISMTVSNSSRGWKWVMDNLQKSFVMRRGFIFKTLGTQRALLVTRGEVARHQMLEAGSVFL